MAPVESATVLEDGKAVALTWPDGRSARFHAVWLRDNALDPATRSASNGQRLITVLDLPEDLRIAAATPSSGALVIRFEPEGRAIAFDAAWLLRHAYDIEHRREPGWTAEGVETWDTTLAPRLVRSDWRQCRKDRAALGRWLAAVRRHGVAIMTGVPTESGALCKVAELFGYIRETNYGRWFEVRAEVNPNNLAYTNLGLQAHTDNPYRDPVPTLQLLACLENTVEGGESLVLDGFRAAERLKAENPRGFGLLSGHCARFDYRGSKGVRLAARRPMIELQPDGEMVAVRFNNRSLGAVADVPYADMGDWYAAYRDFARIIEDPALAVKFRLAPGELFIVDNTRVLHARRAFSSGGTRWLQGCYADKDGLLSTLAAIEEEDFKEAAE